MKKYFYVAALFGVLSTSCIKAETPEGAAYCYDKAKKKFVEKKLEYTAKTVPGYSKEEAQSFNGVCQSKLGKKGKNGYKDGKIELCNMKSVPEGFSVLSYILNDVSGDDDGAIFVTVTIDGTTYSLPVKVVEGVQFTKHSETYERLNHAMDLVTQGKVMLASVTRKTGRVSVTIVSGETEKGRGANTENLRNKIPSKMRNASRVKLKYLGNSKSVLVTQKNDGKIYSAVFNGKTNTFGSVTTTSVSGVTLVLDAVAVDGLGNLVFSMTDTTNGIGYIRVRDFNGVYDPIEQFSDVADDGLVVQTRITLAINGTALACYRTSEKNLKFVTDPTDSKTVADEMDQVKNVSNIKLNNEGTFVAEVVVSSGYMQKVVGESGTITLRLTISADQRPYSKCITEDEAEFYGVNDNDEVFTKDPFIASAGKFVFFSSNFVSKATSQIEAALLGSNGISMYKDNFFLPVKHSKNEKKLFGRLNQVALGAGAGKASPVAAVVQPSIDDAFDTVFSNLHKLDDDDLWELYLKIGGALF